jgi:hypothetical protein
MGYYIRVLSQSAKPVTLAAVEAVVAKTGLGVRLEDIRKVGRVLTSFTVVTTKGDPVLVFERNPVEEGSVSEGDMEQIAEARPASAAKWLADYLPRTKVIYTLQLFGRESHRAVIDAVRNLAWNLGPAVLQADLEGFSNEAGYHILWQFSDRVTGPWWMAVLDARGNWHRFQMDLGNPAHQASWHSSFPAAGRLAAPGPKRASRKSLHVPDRPERTLTGTDGSLSRARYTSAMPPAPKSQD